MQGKVNSRKENKIRVFGCVLENSLENDFRCLEHSKNAIFLQIFHIFSASKTNFITENFNIYT